MDIAGPGKTPLRERPVGLVAAGVPLLRPPGRHGRRDGVVVGLETVVTQDGVAVAEEPATTGLLGGRHSSLSSTFF